MLSCANSTIPTQSAALRSCSSLILVHVLPEGCLHAAVPLYSMPRLSVLVYLCASQYAEVCLPWDQNTYTHATLTYHNHQVQGPYFLGTDLSLVDLVYTPFLERIAASLAYYKGYFIRGQGTYPHVEAWFDAMETRETYLATRADYYSSCHDLPPQLGGAC